MSETEVATNSDWPRFLTLLELKTKIPVSVDLPLIGYHKISVSEEGDQARCG